MHKTLCLIASFSVNTAAFNLPSSPINCHVLQATRNIRKRTNPQFNNQRTQSAFGRPRIRSYSFLMAEVSPDENQDRKKKGFEKDISKYLKNEKDADTQDTNQNSDRNPSKKGNPSILPPPSRNISSRFPSQKRGSKAKMRRAAPVPRGEGENYKSILPPPPTTDNEQFPDRRKERKYESGGRGGRRKSSRPTGRGSFVGAHVGERKFIPKREKTFRASPVSKEEEKEGDKKSLLPPKEDAAGLASWDDFFSTNLQSTSDNSNTKANKENNEDTGKGGLSANQDYFEKSLDQQVEKINGLPSTSYLFGNISNDPGASKSSKEARKSESKGGVSAPSSLDGVLPVSELFYRSTQSISAEDNVRNDSNDENDRYLRKQQDDYSIGEEETDDEELPFSAEQSDRILSMNNKIMMRRNNAMRPDEDGPIKDEAQYKTDIAKFRSALSPPPRTNNQNAGKKNRRKRGANNHGRSQQRGDGQGRGRKMVRRGMEMLVGGEPINADPPLRLVELNYCLRSPDSLTDGLLLLKDDDADDDALDLGNGLPVDWASVVTTNSRDFGPLLHQPSVEKVSDTSRQLYCEHFVNSSIKWNVCPKDLKDIVKQYEIEKASRSPQTYADLIEKVSSVKFDDPQSIEMRFEERRTDVQAETKGFGKEARKMRRRSSGSVDFNAQRSATDSDNMNRAARRSNSKLESFTLGGELKFSLGVTRAELESGHDGGSHGHILRRVLGKGIANAIKAESLGFQVVIAKMLLSEVDGGSTEFHVEFNMIPEDSMKYGEVEWAAKIINSALAQAMDDGDMALAMGAAAKAETSWPAKVRNRVVEEFLFDAEDADGDPLSDDDEEEDSSDEEAIDDEDDFEALREDEDLPLSNSQKQQDEEEFEDEDLPLPNSKKPQNKEEFDGPFGMPGDTIYAKDDIYLGGGNGGVFPDYSENSKWKAPFSGELGPLLLDAVTQRALEKQPRVIAIGDVHGCIDELQALLRRCDYRPGDLIVFLGDLVSKGPDSLAVVQMARELGAMGVRGNHDFEVIRWHQAIKSGM